VTLMPFALENLLRIADCIEGSRTGADRPDAHPAQAAHDAADGKEALHIGAEGRIQERDDMPAVRETGGRPALRLCRRRSCRRTRPATGDIEGGRDRRDTPARGPERRGGQLRVSATPLVAEVRQHDQHAREVVAVRRKRSAHWRASACVSTPPSFVSRVEHDGRQASPRTV